MKYLMQFSLILSLWALGEILSALIAPYFFIPGNIVGMVLLLVGLLTGVIKESHIKEVATFFLNHMAFFFIPLAVNLLGQQLNLEWGLLFVITLVTTPVIMIVTTFVTDKMMKLKENITDV